MLVTSVARDFGMYRTLFSPSTAQSFKGMLLNRSRRGFSSSSIKRANRNELLQRFLEKVVVCTIGGCVLLQVGASVTADTEIYRCPLEDGTFAFQETPCPEPTVNADDGSKTNDNSGDDETPAARDDAFDFVNPFDEPLNPPADSEPALPEPVSQDRTECEKTTRDAIDAIDFEMQGNAYSKEQGQVYLAELRVLTRQLRACKQL